MEHPGVVDVPALEPPSGPGVEPSLIGLVRFDDGSVDRRALGWAHPHGGWLRWQRQGDA